jgi:SAM-dependent methyltransferase
MRHRPRGTESTVDRDGPPGERLSLRRRSFTRRRAEPRVDAPDSTELLSAEAVAAQLAPREPVPPLDAPTIRQWLWGRGFYVPGDARHVLELVRSLALEPAMGLLDAAAGLGGPARVIAEEYGVTVSALERDPDLARRGMEMSAASGLRKQAPVKVLHPETFELRAATFDRVLAREATDMVQDKERFLRVLVLALKPPGQLLMTDFVIEPSSAERPALGAWAALQPHRPMLWSLRQYSDCLRSLGLELRMPEDMTDAYKRQILGGWDNLLQTVNLRSLPRADRLAIVDELEHWVRTITALDSGALKMYRFHALPGPVPRR